MSGVIEATNLQTANIKHTNGTTAATISSGGAVTLASALPIASGGTGQTASAQNAQTFRLSQDINGTSNLQMFTPFEEADTDYTRVGSANWTVNAGAFSVATTGTYLCLYNVQVSGAGGGDEFDINIQISTNSGASYIARSRTFGFAPGQKIGTSNQFIFTVSATSGFRLRMVAGMVNGIASGSTIHGDSDMTETGITFVKLGVI